MIIAVDFDGTCVKHRFPEVGEDIGAAKVLHRLVANGHKLILWTMRSNNGELDLITPEGIDKINGDFLTDAVNWFAKNKIPLWGIQTNPEQKGWTTSPKCYAEVYIDDAAFGCPLIKLEGERPFVDWETVEFIMEQKGFFNDFKKGEI